MIPAGLRTRAFLLNETDWDCCLSRRYSIPRKRFDQYPVSYATGPSQKVCGGVQRFKAIRFIWEKAIEKERLGPSPASSRWTAHNSSLGAQYPVAMVLGLM